MTIDSLSTQIVCPDDYTYNTMNYQCEKIIIHLQFLTDTLCPDGTFDTSTLMCETKETTESIKLCEAEYRYVEETDSCIGTPQFS